MKHNTASSSHETEQAEGTVRMTIPAKRSIRSDDSETKELVIY
jgi:hypothetical protein